MARFLVTGGAGYVGSHVVLALLDDGHDVVVFDSLRTGHRSAVPDAATFIHGDLADLECLNRVLADGPWDGVLHFAALSLVGESMQDPMLYMSANAGIGFGLIDACVRHGIKRFVFSSTAALFGSAGDEPISEDTPVDPGSPYGESKYMVERALYWADRIHGLKSACLRYFNAAGADPAGRAGEDHRPETHLIPLVIDAALKRRAALTLFGQDYPTPDGTCIRDYVHVTDLARAHLAVLPLLNEKSVTFNVGTGRGNSNREIIESVARVTGLEVPWQAGDRRPGDPPCLVASPKRLMAATGWAPEFTDIDRIVETAFAWRKDHPQGYAD
ncbi:MULTISPECIES: UDP-glucose 4-epimerase GalE [Acetobacter]|uniref:UDP-glucose 4-epimerase n=1 Tax=Acetobacter cerevisiae TaxID=178900 RepID=A0A149Q574_9PROT|nr:MULTISPECIES: UDP-glucose 4-epimerase GalE [Acetobacter]KXU92404.1 UDP-glucose 4-epimerase [Acetobacter cerevisiae]KXV78922.1 UDP-glucose 4-epimerase [Acetobacter cerevisiae]MCP1271084.1 UDP-glucose 4-epimerase GalE [Acetobacter cerevisiae]MCP1279038.1 UDP-glucose 4-epimerase GalE [Acetobacter cerevisiae]GBQ06047.1 UDP-glucose 4-epimerase [Acetobacter cerevisiae DSM 14362]